MQVKPNDEKQRLVNKSSDEEIIEENLEIGNKTGGSETCHNNTDNDEDEMDESLASKLLNRETCV